MLKKSKVYTVIFVSLFMLFALCSSAFAATVGQQLPAPEEGWKRIDETNASIVYNGWEKGFDSSAYNGSLQYTNASENSIKFSFLGSKLRIIGATNSGSKSVEVKIDNEIVEFYSCEAGLTWRALLYEKTNLDYKIHTVTITNKTTARAWFDAIDIDSTGEITDTVLNAPSNLTAVAGNSKIDLNWTNVTEAATYNVKRSTAVGGPYTTTIATNVTGTTYSDTNVTNGTTYYYVVSAVNASGESANSNEASATLPLLKPQLDVVIAEEKVNVGQEFTSNIVLKNTTGIYAEDFTIQYDNVHLEYLGFEEVPGYKVYNTPTDTNGTLRFVVASQGAGYGINSETTFLKLKFKAKAVGIGKVDATKGRIADTTNEFDLDAANCLEDTVIIQNQDVNMTGEYTLLDLAIDAAHFGELGSTVDPTKYVANQVGDDTIRDEDLVFIVAQMLANTNYAPNHR